MMAIAASMLRNELRRHLLINGCLVASCIVGGTVVTNERGLFVPIGLHGMSATARAFAAMFSPANLSELHGIRMVMPLSPFEVTADPRDLRKRLMDSLDFLPEQAALSNEEEQQLARFNGANVSSAEVAQNTAGGAASAAGTGAATTDGGTPAASDTASPFGGTPGDILPNSSLIGGTGGTVPSTAAGGGTSNGGGTDIGGGGTSVIGSAVPEPSVWAMMIAGFGMMGFVQRARAARRRRIEEATLA